MASFNQSETVLNQTLSNLSFFPVLPAFKPWLITSEFAAKISAYSTILVVSILTNTFILYTVKRNANGRMKTSSNLVLVSLSISNLTIIITCVPRLIEALARGSSVWIVSGTLGLCLCKMTYFLADQGIAASFLATVALSFDWFLAVVFPLKKRVNAKITHCAIILTWISATSYAAPILYSTGLRQFWGKTYCAKGVDKIPAWNTLKIVLLGPLPLALVVILNSAVIMKLWCRQTPGTQPDRYSFRRAKETRHRRKNRKAFRLLLAVILVYYICFLPYWIVFIDAVYFKTSQISGSVQVAFSAVCLAYSSSALTPSVLIILSENFRVEAVYIIKWVAGRKARRRVVPVDETKTRTQTQTQNRAVEIENTRNRADTELFLLSPVARAVPTQGNIPHTCS